MCYLSIISATDGIGPYLSAHKNTWLVQKRKLRISKDNKYANQDHFTRALSRVVESSIDTNQSLRFHR